MSEFLCALGFKRCTATEDLFASAAYYEENGFYGITPLSLVRRFLRDVACPPPIDLCNLGEKAPHGTLVEETISTFPGHTAWGP